MRDSPFKYLAPEARIVPLLSTRREAVNSRKSSNADGFAAPIAVHFFGTDRVRERILAGRIADAMGNDRQRGLTGLAKLPLRRHLRGMLASKASVRLSIAVIAPFEQIRRPDHPPMRHQ